jgi:hypothetical protein
VVHDNRWRGAQELDAATGSAAHWDASADDWVLAVAVSGSTVFAGGQFTNIGGLPHSGFAAIQAKARNASVVECRDPHRGAASVLVDVDVSPNPLTDSVDLRGALAQDAHLSVRVFDVLGREIARVVDRPAPAGSFATTWGGDGPSGRVAPGVYFVRCEAGGESVTKRVVVLK